MAFKDELKRNIAAKIKSLKRDGVTSMGFDNLMQVIIIPRIADAPRGTNGFFYVKEIAREILNEDKALGRFVHNRNPQRLLPSGFKRFTVTIPGTSFSKPIVARNAKQAKKRRKNPRRSSLSVPERHQLAIARHTLQMNDVMARVMGGPTKAEAREIIKRLTGKTPRGNPRRRTTEDEWVIQGKYGRSWEDVTTDVAKSDAKTNLRAYRDNERGTPFRLIKRRVKLNPRKRYTRKSRRSSYHRRSR